MSNAVAERNVANAFGDPEAQIMATHKLSYIGKVLSTISDSPLLRTTAIMMVDQFLRVSGDRSSRVAVFKGEDEGMIELVIQVDDFGKRLEFEMSEVGVTSHAVTLECVYSQPTAKRPYNADRLFAWLLNASPGRPDS